MAGFDLQAVMKIEERSGPGQVFSIFAGFDNYPDGLNNIGGVAAGDGKYKWPGEKLAGD